MINNLYIDLNVVLRFSISLSTALVQISTKYHRNNRTMLLAEALDNLPISSSAYVVYAVRQQRIHIVSKNVNSLYCVVKSQCENMARSSITNYRKYTCTYDSW